VSAIAEPVTAAPRAAGVRRLGRHLRVVPEHRPRHTLAFALLYLLVGAAVVFGTVSVNALAAGDAVTAQQLEREVQDAERRYELLTAEVAHLEDPARIEQAARELGMVRAESPRYLVVGRTLPADGAGSHPVPPGETPDPLKPVLSVQP
jgi:cell division protein FtsL